MINIVAIILGTIVGNIIGNEIFDSLYRKDKRVSDFHKDNDVSGYWRCRSCVIRKNVK